MPKEEKEKKKVVNNQEKQKNNKVRVETKIQTAEGWKREMLKLHPSVKLKIR